LHRVVATLDIIKSGSKVSTFPYAFSRFLVLLIWHIPASKPMWSPRTFTVGWWVCGFWMGLDMCST